jgi:AcrR family transcriptional regulator
MARPYRLGKRQAAAERTRDSILEAARDLASSGPAAGVSLADVARRAGVSRLTVYNRFGSRARLWEALAGSPGPPASEPPGDPRLALRERLEQACAAWSVNPALYRNLGVTRLAGTEHDRRLAEALASVDALRAGCSIKEAEDVIGALASFAVFDRLHQDGRRSASAVAGILQRLASGILA